MTGHNIIDNHNDYNDDDKTRYARMSSTEQGVVSQKYRRQDVVSWGLFAVLGSALWTGLIWSTSWARGWAAESRYDHDVRDETRGMQEYPEHLPYVYYYWQIHPIATYGVWLDAPK